RAATTRRTAACRTADLAAETVAAAPAEPILANRPGIGPGPRWPSPGAVVLQAAVRLVVAARVDGDVIELADGVVVQMVPDGHAIVGDVEAAVAADDGVPAILRVDPQGVLVGVDAPAAVGPERLAAVARTAQLHART